MGSVRNWTSEQLKGEYERLASRANRSLKESRILNLIKFEIDKRERNAAKFLHCG